MKRSSTVSHALFFPLERRTCGYPKKVRREDKVLCIGTGLLKSCWWDAVPSPKALQLHVFPVCIRIGHKTILRLMIDKRFRDHLEKHRDEAFCFEVTRNNCICRKVYIQNDKAGRFFFEMALEGRCSQSQSRNQRNSSLSNQEHCQQNTPQDTHTWCFAEGPVVVPIAFR